MTGLPARVFHQYPLNKDNTRNTCIAEPREARAGGGPKMSGMEGGRELE